MNENIHILRPALVLELDAEMARLGLSQNRAAKRIGIHASALSQWRAGKYGGDNAAIESAIRKWLNTEEEMDGAALGSDRIDAHVALGVTSEISSLLAYAKATGDIVLVQGISGTGKSWATQRYADTRSAVHYVPMTAAVRSLNGMLGRVSEAAGGHRKHGSALEAEDDIVQRLRGQSALLIVDEAHHLTPRLLDQLRCLCSREHAGCGLAYVGDETIEMKLENSRQITGRIGARMDRRAVAEGDIELMLSSFLERPAKRRELALAVEAARGAGGLHALRRMLIRAWRRAQIEERDAVSLAELEMASAPAEGRASA